MIFAANHASHIDTPLLLTTLPVEFRHRTVVAAASDYFFDRTWKSVLWSFSLGRHPDRAEQGQPQVGRHRRRAGRGRLEPGDLPRGRSLARRLDRSPSEAAPPTWPGARAGPSCRCTSTAPATCWPRTQRPRTVHRVGRGRRGAARRGLRRAPATVTFGPALEPREGEDARHLAARIERAVSVLGAEARSDWWTARRLQAEGALPDPRGPEASPWRRAWALGPRRQPGQVEPRRQSEEPGQPQAWRLPGQAARWAQRATEPRASRTRWPDLRPGGRRIVAQ